MQQTRHCKGEILFFLCRGISQDLFKMLDAPLVACSSSDFVSDFVALSVDSCGSFEKPSAAVSKAYTTLRHASDKSAATNTDELGSLAELSVEFW